MVPLAGKTIQRTAKVSRSKVPIIKEGIDTKKVVSTMISLSVNLLRRRAANVPSPRPTTTAITAAVKPKGTDTDSPSKITSPTVLPRCFRLGPKSSRVTTSRR